VSVVSDTDRITLSDPITGLRPVRTERQRWERLGRARGELQIGYDACGRPVRVEYHWIRHLSRADPKLDDVYTAELWVRQPDGDWLYIVQPGQDAFIRIPHEPLKELLLQHLDLDLQ